LLPPQSFRKATKMQGFILIQPKTKDDLLPNNDS
jgi:hypothetical protein